MLTNATGVSSQQVDSERSYYYSRGFQITDFSYDNIPTTTGDAWNYGDAAEDTAIYDRIEIVRGANGLMTGAGDPGATVNMVRKHADSKTFTGNLSASYGSWNAQRYVADLSAPLNADGSVRGRVIAGYQNQEAGIISSSIPATPPGAAYRACSATDRAPATTAAPIPRPTGRVMQWNRVRYLPTSPITGTTAGPSS